jgi:hypothetical protein
VFLKKNWLVVGGCVEVGWGSGGREMGVYAALSEKKTFTLYFFLVGPVRAVCKLVGQ